MLDISEKNVRKNKNCRQKAQNKKPLRCGTEVFCLVKWSLKRLVQHPGPLLSSQNNDRRRGPAPDEKVHLQEPCNFLATKL